MSDEPYYQDDWVTLHHGDAMDILPTIAPGSVHHAITDPPYILQAGSSTQRGSKTGGWADMMNASHWYAAWFRLVSATLKETGSLWTFGNWRSLPVLQRAAIDADISAASCMVWNKSWIGPAGPQQLRHQYELCLVLARDGFKITDRSQGDVLTVPTSGFKPTGHPAEKPVTLLRRIIEIAGTNPGDLILDPFTGSGTALVAAKSIGARAIGIESEERWCEVAANRLLQDSLPFEVTA